MLDVASSSHPPKTSRRKTALCVWELGEGLGHIPTLKAIAAALQLKGWAVVFALREPVSTRAALAELNCTILPAPFWPTATVTTDPTWTYADILAANGFASVSDLSILMHSWEGVFAAAKPDLIVCEHAPSAAVAAFGRIPTAFVGNGFVVPPADAAEFIAYKPLLGGLALQPSILTVIQDALARVGRTPPQTITEPFRGVFRAVYAFPELDPYRAVRKDLVLGPLESLPALKPMPATPRLFAYSATDYALIDELTAALMALGPAASAYFRGTIGARGAVLKSRGVGVFSEAPLLSDVLPEATCVFSHAGTGLTAAALGAGRPQIVSPRHGEADVTAKLLEELGVAISIMPLERKRLTDAVRRANERGMRDAARKAGEAAHAFVEKSDALNRTVAALAASA